MKAFQILILAGLIFGLIPPDLPAAEKRGSDIVVFKLDGTEAIGELIAVKADSLLLLEKSSGRDVSVAVSEIHSIRVTKRAKSLANMGLGAAAGFVLGGLITFAHPGSAESQGTYFFYGAAAGVPLGALTGLLISGAQAHDSTYLLAGITALSQEKILHKLRKHARMQ